MPPLLQGFIEEMLRKYYGDCTPCPPASHVHIGQTCAVSASRHSHVLICMELTRSTHCGPLQSERPQPLRSSPCCRTTRTTRLPSDLTTSPSAPSGCASVIPQLLRMPHAWATPHAPCHANALDGLHCNCRRHRHTLSHPYTLLMNIGAHAPPDTLPLCLSIMGAPAVRQVGELGIGSHSRHICGLWLQADGRAGVPCQEAEGDLAPAPVLRQRPPPRVCLGA